MICVVIYHSIVFWTGTWDVIEPPVYSSNGLLIIAKWLNSFHIYGFALCSGYLYSYIKNENNGYLVYKDFVSTKFKRLIIPYIFVAAIWAVPISIAVDGLKTFDVIERYVFTTNPSQLWFLWMLFDLFIIVWPLTKYLQKDAREVLISVVFFLVGVVGSALLPNVFRIWTAFSYLPFFIVGMKLREKPIGFCGKSPFVATFLLMECFLQHNFTFQINMAANSARTVRLF